MYQHILSTFNHPSQI